MVFVGKPCAVVEPHDAVATPACDGRRQVLRRVGRRELERIDERPNGLGSARVLRWVRRARREPGGVTLLERELAPGEKTWLGGLHIPGRVVTIGTHEPDEARVPSSGNVTEDHLVGTVPSRVAGEDDAVGTWRELAQGIGAEAERPLLEGFALDAATGAAAVRLDGPVRRHGRGDELGPDGTVPDDDAGGHLSRLSLIGSCATGRNVFMADPTPERDLLRECTTPDAEWKEFEAKMDAAFARSKRRKVHLELTVHGKLGQRIVKFLGGLIKKRVDVAIYIE